MDVLKTAGVVVHKVKNPGKIKKGKVRCEVNLSRRKTISIQHTCAHILNAAARKVLGNHIWQAGSYKDEEKAHLDVTHYKRITNDELNEIERIANEYIRQNLPIKVDILPRNTAEKKYGFRLYQGGVVPGKELRIVSIGDIDHEACGGTHHMLNSTGESGYFKIVKREGVQDGIERIVFKAGDVAVKYVQEKEDLIGEASSALSVSDSELVNSVKRFFEEWKLQRKKIEQMAEKIARMEEKEIASEFKKSGKPVVKVVNLDAEIIRKIAVGACNIEKEAGVCIMNNKGDVACACGEKSKYDAGELLKKVIKQLGGKGGGRGRIAFGKVSKVSRVDI